MNYSISVVKETIYRPDIELYTGNIGAYTFTFDFDENWQGLIKFASFSKNNETYIIEIIDNTVCVPYELLLEPGTCSFGVYATNGEDDIKRISSNILEFNIIDGVYSPFTIPKTPTPDVWEVLFKNSIPKIIDGYWYLYSPQDGIYVNTGINSVGQFPVNGIDYFTENEKEIFVAEVEKRSIGNIDKALNEIIAIQNKLIGGDGV